MEQLEYTWRMVYKLLDDCDHGQGIKSQLDSVRPHLPYEASREL